MIRAHAKERSPFVRKVMKWKPIESRPENTVSNELGRNSGRQKIMETYCKHCKKPHHFIEDAKWRNKMRNEKDQKSSPRVADTPFKGHAFLGSAHIWKWTYLLTARALMEIDQPVMYLTIYLLFLSYNGIALLRTKGVSVLFSEIELLPPGDSRCHYAQNTKIFQSYLHKNY